MEIVSTPCKACFVSSLVNRKPFSLSSKVEAEADALDAFKNLVIVGI